MPRGCRCRELGAGPRGWASGDEPYYARIAAHPQGPDNFPYAFRIGLPYLIHALPFSPSLSWASLALLAAAIAGGALFSLLREFEIGARLACGLAVGFTISPPLLVVFLRNGLEVDAAAIMIIMLGSLFMVRRQLIPLAISCWPPRLRLPSFNSRAGGWCCSPCA